MNYIKQLQAENEGLKAKLNVARVATTDFMAFLQSSKFTGTENGEAKDWISTSDVQKWLTDHRMILLED